MSVVAFDDTFASHLLPPLTSVRQPMFEMGMRAATAAIERLGDGAGRRRTVMLPMELVLR